MTYIAGYQTTHWQTPVSSHRASSDNATSIKLCCASLEGTLWHTSKTEQESGSELCVCVCVCACMCACACAWVRTSQGAFWQIDSLTASWTSYRAKWPLDTQTGLHWVSLSFFVSPPLSLPHSFHCFPSLLPCKPVFFQLLLPTLWDPFTALWSQLHTYYLLLLLLFTVAY